MTNFEMVETLRQHANVSYEETRKALEQTNWDILEAMVLLEKEGKVAGGAAYTTKTEHRQEERRTGHFREGMGRVGRALARLIQRGNANHLEVSRKGEVLFSLPVTLLVLLLIVWSFLTIALLIIGLFTGFRYAFRGPDLGKPVINDAMGKASDFAENIGKKEKEEE